MTPELRKGFATMINDRIKASKIKQAVAKRAEALNRCGEISQCVNDIMHGADFTLPQFIDELSHTAVGFTTGRNTGDIHGIKLNLVNSDRYQLLWLNTGQFAESPVDTLAAGTIKPIDSMTMAVRYGVDESIGAICSTLSDVMTALA